MKETFCKGAQNIVHYARVNNKLPDRILVKSPIVTIPDKLVLADMPPEFKVKVLKDKIVSSKWSRTSFYHFDCINTFESIDKPLTDYYFLYDSLNNIIVLTLGTVNEKSQKREHFYFIALLDLEGGIKEIQESFWVEK
jgi:hypothetical protein